MDVYSPHTWSDVVGELWVVHLPDSKCRFVQGNGLRVFCCLIPGWKGLFSKDHEPTRKFADRVCRTVKKRCGGRGFFTSDEALAQNPVYRCGWQESEVQLCAARVGAKTSEDTIAIFAYEQGTAEFVREGLIEVLQSEVLPELPDGGRPLLLCSVNVPVEEG